MRVLIVEDDPTVAEVLRDLCVELGHSAETVQLAEDAVVRLQAARPDLILLDFRLPRMSGLDFLRLPLVRSAGVPIIVVSGIASESQAQECLRLGAVQFLAKPVPLARLRGILEWVEQPVRTRPLEPAAPGVERRRSPRARVALPVRVRDDDGTEWEGTSVDLSVEGMKITAARPVRSGRTVEISFVSPLEDQSVTIRSILLRADVDGYVFYFMNLTEEHFERLTYLLRRLAG